MAQNPQEKTPYKKDGSTEEKVDEFKIDATKKFDWEKIQLSAWNR